MTRIRSWRICGSPINPSLIGGRRGTPSTMRFRQMKAKSGLGGPSGLRCPRKTGSWIEPLAVLSSGVRDYRRPPERAPGFAWAATFPRKPWAAAVGGLFHPGASSSSPSSRTHREHHEQSVISIDLGRLSRRGVTVHQLYVTFGNMPFPEGRLLSRDSDLKETNVGMFGHSVNMRFAFFATRKPASIEAAITLLTERIHG
jgi:hypothetical protein